MSEHVENLKRHLTHDFSMPDHLKAAFHAWIDSVEERVGGSVGRRVSAVERAVADIHAALSEKPAPKSVQDAVADVDLPRAPRTKG
jgi:hypothetical protein